jgi:decaprenyl-phosphate phosphoribosyltransferase
VSSTRVPATTLPPVVAALRPKQWLKNVLVFAAPAAAEVLNTWEAWRQSLLAFAAFSAAASTIYIINDIADLEADRRHPTKRFRPIAAGTLSLSSAKVLAAVTAVVAVVFALATREPTFMLVLAIYVATSIVYSWWFKHEVILDLVIVALGFLLRAISGALAVDVPISSWFLIVISFGSLFVVTGKRLAELEELGDEAVHVRPTLHRYSVPFLRFVMSVTCTGAALAYCIFAFQRADTASNGGSVWFQLSAIPVVTALLRYALAVEAGEGAAPEDVFTRDRALQVLGVLWAVLFGIGLLRG